VAGGESDPGVESSGEEIAGKLFEDWCFFSIKYNGITSVSLDDQYVLNVCI